MFYKLRIKLCFVRGTNSGVVSSLEAQCEFDRSKKINHTYLV